MRSDDKSQAGEDAHRERVAPEQEVPRVAIEWTPEELARLAELLAAPEPPPATAELSRLLRPA